ncbi:MAG TPA: FmdB family zinc ribbon protein [Jatrophihabitans sp.]|nr:FmdB family zinc ribbon protein [Jatrophihabitans sp.]
MPTYQYACTNDACGLNFERVQSFSDAAITDCPDCSGRVRKVYGSVGVVFKGSGFYRTDSRAGSSSSAGDSSPSTSAAKDGASSAGAASNAGSNSSGAGKSDSGSGSSQPKPAAAAAS